MEGGGGHCAANLTADLPGIATLKTPNPDEKNITKHEWFV